MLLKMTGIEKSFAGVHALNGVNFDLHSGEVHALMGENGAGKSTLMKILTGVYQKDSGKLFVEDKEVEYQNTAEAQEDGVVIVHQELNVLNDLTVAENIFIGREKTKNKFIINDRELIIKSQQIFDELGVNIDPEETIRNLTVGQMQMVEIAKAISKNAKIIVFDEPTAALSKKEITELFKIINDLKRNGVGIVYISHRMDEIGVITDRITVLRDGQYIGTVETEKTSKDEIINMMVGRILSEDPKEKSNVAEDSEVIFEVKNITAGTMVKDVSFTLRKGEILGISGLMGAGRTEAIRAIFGADKMDNGEVFIHDKKVDINNTTDAVKYGLGYVSEDRRRYGVLVDQNVEDNIALTNLSSYTNNGLLDDRQIESVSNKYIKQMRIKTNSGKQLVKNLSGGNQQKVVISKWLANDTEILFLDEPTRGIDVGAKSEIYDLMDELVEQGKSIVMISSDMTEILRMSDRIIVMCEGRKTGELTIEEATQEKIMKYATMREEV